MNTGLTEDREALFARARSADWCRSRGIILRGSHSVSTETGWRNALEMATDAEYEQLCSHVKATEIRQAHDAAWLGEFDRARDAREAPLSEDEQAAVDRDAHEAAEIAARSELPATRGQLSELIGLQRDILAALKR